MVQPYRRHDKLIFAVDGVNSFEKVMRLLKKNTKPMFAALRERKLHPKHSERLKVKRRRSFAKNNKM
jgi:hypothetical protein